MRYEVSQVDSFLPEDQREQNGSVASWDPQQQPTSFRRSSFRPQTFPFLRPFWFDYGLWIRTNDGYLGGTILLVGGANWNVIVVDVGR